MEAGETASRRLGESARAAQVALVALAAALLLLAALHVLSPEFDPSWRVVSEYALGGSAWVLSLFFLCWALGTWSVALAIRGEPSTRSGRIGWWVLLAAGAGGALAAVFAVGHPVHAVAGALGVFGFPVAAVLTSRSLVRDPPWSAARKPLLWTAHLTWVVVVVMFATLIMMAVTFLQAGGDLSAPPQRLPSGTIALAGYANRLLVVVHFAWLILVAWLVLRFRAQDSLAATSLSAPA